MKKVGIFGLVSLFGLVGCTTKTKTIYVTQKQEPQIVYVDRPIEVEKTIYVDKPIEVEKTVYVDRPVEIEKIVYVDRPVEVEKIVEVEKVVEVPVEVERIVEVETIKYIKQNYNITFGDDENFFKDILNKNTHFDYLAIYNMSSNTMTNMDYILPATSFGGPMSSKNCLLTATGGLVDTYVNLSCFDYQEGEDLSKYITNCTNRTSPSRYKYESKKWRDTYLGVWILKDVDIQYVHKSEMCSYNGAPLYQVVLTYKDCYTPLQLLTQGVK